MSCLGLLGEDCPEKDISSLNKVEKMPLIHFGIYGGNSALLEQTPDIACMNGLYDGSLITYEQFEQYIADHQIDKWEGI